MVESQKDASSSVNPKEKTSLTDEQIGGDFLHSWKSLSMREDDTMDFQFETATKGKKKAFNFEKLDMDFSLDGDFDKLSSFKVDMPDLDFAFAPKKTGKAMEISEDSTSGKLKEKKDRVSFSFDVNDFNFDSSSIKGENRSKNNPVSKGINTENSENQGSRNFPSEDISACDNRMALLPVLESGAAFKGETSVGGAKNINSIYESCPSNSETNAVASQGVSHVDKFFAANRMISRAEEADKHHHPSEETVSTEQNLKQTTQSLAVQSAADNDSIQGTVTELRAHACLPVKTDSINSGGVHIGDAKSTNGMEANCENLLLKMSPSPPRRGPQSSHSENDGSSDNHVVLGVKDGSNNHVPLEVMDGTRTVVNDLDIEGGFSARTSKNARHSKADPESLNSTSMLLLSALNSDNQTKDKTGGVQSRFIKTLEETQSESHLVARSFSNIISQGKTRIGTMRVNPPDVIREEIKSDSTTLSSKADARLGIRELTKGEPALLKIEKNAKEPCNTNSPTRVTGLTRRMTTSGSEECVNGKLAVSRMDTKQSSILFVKKNESSFGRVSKRLTDLSSFKISRAAPSDTTHQKQCATAQSPETGKKVQGNVASEMVTFDGMQKQISSPSWKRKIFEESNADITALNPPKRLSGTLDESRKITSTSEMLAHKQICSNSNTVDSISKNSDCPMSTWDFPMEASLREVDSTMENDGTVVKAEACMKELENICNMLKKKHEEAKELLVRSIVNNNYLLMLNHPIYDEKFQMIQNFAAQLTSKEPQTTG